MNNFTIRSATTQNLDAVIDLLKKADLPVADVHKVFGENYGIAVMNDSIVGTVGIERHGDVGLFRSAVVRGDLQGKKIGEALTLNRIEWAKARGIKALYLLTVSAADYFPRFGFTAIDRNEVPSEIATTWEFTELCPDSATVMLLKLDG
jgi:amino-acid N-acetyltransferase